MKEKNCGVIQGINLLRERVCGDSSGRKSRETAYLSNDGSYTVFSYGGRRLKFLALRCLKRYLRVKSWDAGYLEVDADYGSRLGVVEEYIDLRPVLCCLMIRASEFLKPIRSVEVCNARKQSS